MTKPIENPWLGQTLRKDYRIDSILGEGGQAVIYRGTDLQMELPIAIKHFKKTSKGVQNDPERFKREARNQAKLVHQNIVTIRAVLEEEDELFIVMEYVNGPTLEELIASSQELPRLPLALIGHIFLQVLRGLAYAHKVGVIHRDIKPSNILITKENKVKLADFGLARAAQDKRLTQAGLVIGTPAYLAPEQMQGTEHLDPRCDIYSVGVTLYESLCGNTPFQRPDEKDVPPFELMGRHLFMEPTPLRELGVPISQEFEQVVLKSIAKDPDDRFADCKEFITALRPVLASMSDTLETEVQDFLLHQVSSQSAEHHTFSEAYATTTEFQPPSDQHLLQAIHETPSHDELEAYHSAETSDKTEEMSIPPTLRVDLSSEQPHTRPPKAENPPWAKIAVILAILLIFMGGFILRETQKNPSNKQTNNKKTNNKQTTQKNTEIPYPQPIAGVKMVKVPAGPFFMGRGRKRTKRTYTPQSEIYLSTYWIDMTEVTVEQYNLCVQAGKCRQHAKMPTLKTKTKDLPITWVNWFDARTFCKWSKKTLPTEAQWEKAARGIKAADYPWGNQNPQCKYANFDGCPPGGVLPVGPPHRIAGRSPYGALDMAGNVWEWVDDCYDREAYLYLDGKNPTLRSNHAIFDKNPHKVEWKKKNTTPWKCLQHVLRGGSWFKLKWGLRAFARRGGFHRMKRKDVGFRCAWNPPRP
ncbi:MAG: hypothetical protein CL920_14600 [Deltaproteobacteria bacterium]|nr:hypothetical protein [Deltaproteobacteria bacterium]MBU49914.1 hypothetical protein [Deltaproteobacteria bacterium]